jgi:hypothetical protein
MDIPEGRKYEDVLMASDPIHKIPSLESRWKPEITFQ